MNNNNSDKDNGMGHNRVWIAEKRNTLPRDDSSPKKPQFDITKHVTTEELEVGLQSCYPRWKYTRQHQLEANTRNILKIRFHTAWDVCGHDGKKVASSLACMHFRDFLFFQY